MGCWENAQGPTAVCVANLEGIFQILAVRALHESEKWLLNHQKVNTISVALFGLFIWVVVILVVVLSLNPSLSQGLTSLIPDVSLTIIFPVPSRVPGIKQFLH